MFRLEAIFVVTLFGCVHFVKAFDMHIKLVSCHSISLSETSILGYSVTFNKLWGNYHLLAIGMKSLCGRYL